MSEQAVNPPSFSEQTLSEKLRIYLDITRPRVMALVIFTGTPALVMGKDVWPSLATAFWILVGTAMAGGASSAFNAYVEREADARMARTKKRPLPASSMLPQVVLAYGVLLTVLSCVVLYAVGGMTPVWIGLATIAFYVLVYTIWLKPRTPQNIVIGGAAGGTAPLIASAAVDGMISIESWVLFAIIFLWTPPHFWGIALFRREEYEAAGYPMMPSVVGDQPTRWRSLAYSIVLVPTTLLPVWTGALSWVYGAIALALGLWFVASVVRSLRDQAITTDYRVFKDSIVYLSILFLFMLIDLGSNGVFRAVESWSQQFV